MGPDRLAGGTCYGTDDYDGTFAWRRIISMNIFIVDEKNISTITLAYPLF